MILSRQNLPVLDRRKLPPADELDHGGYVLSAPAGASQAILIATGSEVQLAVAAQGILAEKGVAASVVSMPSWELFEKMPQSYRDAVLPPNVAVRIAVEAGIGMGWERYTGASGGMFTAERVAEAVLEALSKPGS